MQITIKNYATGTGAPQDFTVGATVSVRQALRTAGISASANYTYRLNNTQNVGLDHCLQDGDQLIVSAKNVAGADRPVAFLRSAA